MSDAHVVQWTSRPKLELRELAAGVLRDELSGHFMQTAFSRGQNRGSDREREFKFNETDSMKGCYII